MRKGQYNPIGLAVDSLAGRIQRLLHPHKRVSLIIPARNEAETIKKVIVLGQKSDLVDEVIVIDSFSTDGTAKVAREAGAHVIRQKKGYKGKGGAMQTALEEVHSEIYVFLDGDLLNPKLEWVDMLLKPILAGEADHVTSIFTSKQRRFTIFTARPLLSLYFPEVKIKKPLSGLFAIKRSVLQDLGIHEGWGIEIAKNIDIVMKGYTTKEVNFGYLSDNSEKDFKGLVPMARTIAKTILEKAIEYDRLPTKEYVDQVLQEELDL